VKRSIPFRSGRGRPLDCNVLVELVTDYFEHALDRRTREAFEAHLTECDGCVNYVEQMRETVRMTGRIREDDLPDDVRTALLAAFREGSGA
jgi:predicted anti-sigma-YlaC factor YlaD